MFKHAINPNLISSLAMKDWYNLNDSTPLLQVNNSLKIYLKYNNTPSLRLTCFKGFIYKVCI